MRKICTFNLPIELIQTMNSEIRRGYRSKFVEESIESRLVTKLKFDLHDIPTIQLAQHLRSFRFTELTDLEKAMLQQLIDRLEAKQ